MVVSMVVRLVLLDEVTDSIDMIDGILMSRSSYSTRRSSIWKLSLLNDFRTMRRRTMVV